MPAWAWWLSLILLAGILRGWRPAHRIGARFGAMGDALARRPGAAEAVVFLVALLLGAIPTIFAAVPPPSTHDEFAYLLAAQTFAEGRLTNPTPPHWAHFETFHQIMVPTYASKFPPAQGLALAAGMRLGHPIVGAWLTVALACAAVCWMLRGWLDDRYALAGGLLAATHPLIFWWGQIYWGGGVALLGGALLGGAFARAMVRSGVRWGIAGGVGASMLANSRPFEGALVTVILLSLLMIRAIRLSALREFALRIVAPAAAVLAPVAAGMMYYNWRVTGEPLVMPYVVHARQYMSAPLLWFQSPPPAPVHRHPKLEQYYAGYEFAEYARQRGVAGFIEHGVIGKWREILRQWIAPPTLALLVLGAVLAMPRWTNPDGRTRSAALLAATLCAGFPILHMLLTPWLRMQYLAPAAGFWFLLLATGARQMSGWRAPTGGAVASGVLLLQLAAVVASIVQMIHNPLPTGAARDAIARALLDTPGDHLILVQYGDGPQSIFEWVFNDADLERSRIVWARDLGEARNRALLEHFAGRRLWRLRVDGIRFDFAEHPTSAGDGEGG